MSQLRLFQTSKPISRKDAAKYVHDFLINELNEKDELDISPAFILKDLYDCRACVNNIAQAFLKGIILPREIYVFGNEDILLAEELAAIEDRIFNPQKRILPQLRLSQNVKRIEFTDIDFNLVRNKAIKLIDVTDIGKKTNSNDIEYIPLNQIIINPYICGNDRFVRLIFICEKGYLSYRAAQIAVRHGYNDVLYSSYD